MKRLTEQQRREQLIQVASRLFAFKGLNGVTTREIAVEAGISEPILYRSFKSKEDLYQALTIICNNQTAAFRQYFQKVKPDVDSLIAMTYLLVRVISFCKTPGAKSFQESANDAEILLRLGGYSVLEDGRFADSLVQNCIGAIFDLWLAQYQAAFKNGHLSLESISERNLWVAYQMILGVGFFSLPAKVLVPALKDEDLATKETVLSVLRGLGVKESVIQKQVQWKNLKKLFESFI